MKTSNTQANARRVGTRRLTALSALCLSVVFSLGCASNREPQAFETPDAAVSALVSAFRANSTDTLRTIFGAEGEQLISSGDEVADRQGRQEFLGLYDQKHALIDEGTDSKTLLIGNTDWPFPIPVVKDDGKWVFDADAGEQEILNRRIGKNELSAIRVCKTIADAQHEYALLDPEGEELHPYAQKFRSEQGKKNGLYWPTAEGEKASPLGAFMAAAAAEGYVAGKQEGSVPYHGYYYHILREQGPGAPDGAMDYVVNGKMILGFAVVAYPADYGNSGIMTFIMDEDGVVYQKDLGEQTAKLAGEMKAFDPGEGWKKVE